MRIAIARVTRSSVSEHRGEEICECGAATCINTTCSEQLSGLPRPFLPFSVDGAIIGTLSSRLKGWPLGHDAMDYV